MSRNTLIGVFVIFVSLGTILFQATRNGATITFFTPEEVYAKPAHFKEKIFRMSGLVQQNSKVWDAKNLQLHFKVTDLKGHEFLVDYHGMPPDLFKEGQGVIIEGQLVNNNFTQKPFHMTADLLLVKHSEVYDSKQDHAQMKSMRLLESMENPQKGDALRSMR